MSIYSMRCPIPPSALPIILNDVKLFLRIRNKDEDSLIKMLMEVATTKLEMYLGMALIPQTWYILYKWDQRDNFVLLPITPIAKVLKIELIDACGVIGVIGESEYRRENDMLLFKNQYFGSMLKITYIAGLVDEADELPGTFRYALYDIVAHLYEYRGSSADVMLDKYSYLRTLKI